MHSRSLNSKSPFFLCFPIVSMLGFLFFCCVSHETPPDRTVLDVIISSGQIGFRSCKLHVGQLIRLSFYTNYGVLSVLNHGNHLLYVGLPSSAGSTLHWFEAPVDVDGFYAMGSSDHAAVEIVAAEETEIRFVACSLDEVLPPCARVVAGHSHEPDLDSLLPSTCFLSTDRGTGVRLIGDTGNASVRIDDHIYNSSAQPPFGGVMLQPFYFARVDGDVSADLELAFSGQNAKYQFGMVTKESGRGVIGKETIYEFVALTGEPYYPDGADIAASMLLFMILIIMSIIAACMCLFMCLLWFLCPSRRMSITSSNTSSLEVLYDRPAVEVIEDGQLGSHEHEKRPDAPPDDKEPERESPYETL
jgi:hypothetical protein